jgi:hypothetical protein
MQPLGEAIKRTLSHQLVWGLQCNTNRSDISQVGWRFDLGNRFRWHMLFLYHQRSFSEICKIYINSTARIFYGHSECFYCGLCKNASSTASHNIVIDEFGRIWKE